MSLESAVDALQDEYLTAPKFNFSLIFSSQEDLSSESVYHKTMTTHQTFHETGVSLSTLKKVILHQWERMVREVISSSRHEQSIILNDHIPELLEQLIDILRSGTVDENELGKSHGFHRAVLTRFSLSDLLTEFSLLRETLMDFLYPIGDVRCAKLVHKYIDILCKYSVIEFAKDRMIKDRLEVRDAGNETREIIESAAADLPHAEIQKH